MWIWIVLAIAAALLAVGVIVWRAPPAERIGAPLARGAGPIRH